MVTIVVSSTVAEVDKAGRNRSEELNEHDHVKTLFHFIGHAGAWRHTGDAHGL